jgi:acetyl esterase
MALDPQIEQILGFVEKAAHPPYHTLTAQAARAMFAKQAPVLDFKPLPMWRVDEVGHAPWSVRIYTPREPVWSDPLPVLFYIHGGGFTIGSSDTHNGLTRYLAHHADCIVVSLDYRLAPEHRFPAAVEDAFDAWQWLQREIAAFGGDPARIAIAGDSAGGTLAAVVCLLARDAGLAQPLLQLLIYPGTHPAQNTPSHFSLAEGYLLTRANILWFFDQYAPSLAERHDWRFAPLEAPDLAGLAPAHVVVADHDPLFDEGVAYAERLRAAGNPVHLKVARGMVHGFFNFGGFSTAARAEVDEVVVALRAGFA